jgi:hypothetical protein
MSRHTAAPVGIARKEAPMSDTPETDALSDKCAETAYDPQGDCDALWPHARKLERERDEARKVAEKLNANVTKGTQYLRFPWEGADNE